MGDRTNGRVPATGPSEPVIGYHASHEQFGPSELLEFVRRAEAAGFDAAMCSDHFQPWGTRQGHSGFAWSWLGAALEGTRLSFGTVNAPGQRYHPAIVAQAAATLAVMYPDRLWLALGSGEAVNEAMTGQGWPAKSRRHDRLRECVEIIRALFAGATVTHDGLVTVEDARLWTRPERPPALLGAAITPETAGWVAGWADGLITVAQPRDKLRAVIDAFRGKGGVGKPMYLQVPLSFARTDDEARRAAHERWRQSVLPSPILADLRSPAQFDQVTASVGPEEIEGALRISSDAGRHADWLAGDLELGFERLYLHNVGVDQARFIDTFGRDVLPQLRASAQPSARTNATQHSPSAGRATAR